MGENAGVKDKNYTYISFGNMSDIIANVEEQNSKIKEDNKKSIIAQIEDFGFNKKEAELIYTAIDGKPVKTDAFSYKIISERKHQERPRNINAPGIAVLDDYDTYRCIDMSAGLRNLLKLVLKPVYKKVTKGTNPDVTDIIPIIALILHSPHKLTIEEVCIYKVAKLISKQNNSHFADIDKVVDELKCRTQICREDKTVCKYVNEGHCDMSKERILDTLKCLEKKKVVKIAGDRVEIIMDF